MDKEELNQARTNPEFLSFLEEKEQNAIKSRDIKELYEVLDTLLVLNLDEARINKVYEEILKTAFDNIEKRLSQNKPLILEDEDFYYIRSFYEHAIEKWSLGNYDGAKELFFILTQIIDDKKLIDALNIHLINCVNCVDMDMFYEELISKNMEENENNEDEKYGYFITDFKIDVDDYLKQHISLLENQFKKMEHLLR